MRPLKFDAFKKAAAVILGCGLLGTAALLLVEKSWTAAAFLKCSVPLMTAGAVSAILWLLHLVLPQVTVSEEGVRIEHSRKGLNIYLPWNQFAYLYKIELSTLTKIYPFFLLTDKPLDKQMQKEMYEKCAKNRETPWVHEGCLLMNAYHYGTEIMKRLPAHIRIMPWSECAHF